MAKWLETQARERPLSPRTSSGASRRHSRRKQPKVAKRHRHERRSASSCSTPLDIGFSTQYQQMHTVHPVAAPHRIRGQEDPSCLATEHYRPASFTWGSKMLRCKTLPSPRQNKTLNTLLHISHNNKWATTNQRAMQEEPCRTSMLMGLAKKRVGSDSFSRFQEDAIMKNVNLKAINHNANLTESPYFMANRDLAS